jgi:copper transport protein
VTPRRRIAVLALAAAAALALPALAWAHAALVRTSPSASGTVNTPPRRVLLTFTEAVEPRFAVISVTDAAGNQQTTDTPSRSAVDPKTLVVPLKELSEGWYLVYWRVISVDGHPVRGAFTFAVGPNPGPQPQFVIPKISETAATPRLIAARTIVFLAVMGAIGLFLLRIAIARPVVRRVRGTRLRAVSIAFFLAGVIGLVAIPVYVDLATAQFALAPSVFDLGKIVPLMRSSAFGRGYLDMELTFALFVLAAALAIWVDRPERERRSVAELLSVGGALLAAGATLLIPGVAGHAGQTSPRGAAVTFDWFHLAAGSVWVGGLIGLLVLWRSLPVARRVAGLVVCVPRFSNTAFVSVLVLIGAGTGAAVLHLPTFASFWQTSYGQTLIVKIALLAAAMLLASVNLLRTKPRLQACDRRPELGPGAASLLRRLVSGEVLLVSGAVFAAAVLSSLPPPAKALATAGKASAHVGPGAVTEVVNKNGYRLEFRFQPNRAAVPNSFSVRIARGGEPVRGAEVTLTFAMLDMEMGTQAYVLRETSPGVYEHSAPALVMVGHWGLSFQVTPSGGRPFTVILVDKAGG